MSDVIPDSVVSTVEINGSDGYGLIEGEINNNTKKEAAKAEVVIYKPPEERVPEFNDDVKIFINDELTYRGLVKKTDYQEGKSPRKIKLICYDIIRELKNVNFTSTYARNKEEVFPDEEVTSKEDYPYEKSVVQHVEDVVGKAFSEIDADYSVEEDLIFTIDTSSAKYKNERTLEAGDDYYPNNVEGEVTVGVGEDIENFGLVIDVSDQSCKATLDKIAKIAGGIWYVNRENKIVFGKPKIPKENEGGSGYKLNYIKKREDGENKPPYRGVKVIGADITSINTKYSKNKVGITTKQTRRYNPTIVEKGKKPYYKHNDADIKTQEQAEKVAKNLLAKIKSEENSGKVEVVKDTQVLKPYMVVEYPDDFGGHLFMVKSVKHTVNNDDGFFSTIELGSLVDPKELEV